MVWGDRVATANSYQLRVEAAADDVVQKLHRADHTGDPLTTADLERVLPAGHQITLTTPDGATLVAGPVGATGPTDQEEIAGVGTLRLTDDTGGLARSHLQAGLAIVGIGLVLALIATLLALRTSRRLTDADRGPGSARRTARPWRPAALRQAVRHR